ncbi:MAG: hypothetical protein EBQ80_03270 [Proteobacteria bacterium]|nr:hypothetical protein [Pseudomonadota bacterium]
MRGLLRGLPHVDFGVEHDGNDQEKAEKMWPVLRQICEGMVEHKIADYVLEGVILLPKHVRELEADFPEIFRGCFLGYSTIDLSQLIARIRSDQSGDNWLRNFSEKDITNIFERGVQESVSLQRQCDEMNVRFFDVAHEFDGTLLTAKEYLIGSKNLR